MPAETSESIGKLGLDGADSAETQPKPPGWFTRHWAMVRAALDYERSLGTQTDQGAVDREFLPAVLEVTSTPASPVGRWTSILLCSFFTITVLWSIFGFMDIIATSPGKIIPSVPIQIIQPKQVGVIREIHVKEGQMVKAGDALVELDPTETTADSDRFSNEVMLARLEAARLRALLGGIKPKDFAGVPGASVANIELHRTYLRSEQEEHAAALDSLDNQIAQVDASIKGTGSEITRLEKIMPLVRERAESRRDLLARGATPRMEYLETEQALIDAEQQLDIQRNRLDESKASLRTLQSQRQQADAEFRSEQLGRLAQTEVQIDNLSQELIKAKDRNSLMTLSAPVSGKIQQLAINTIGGVVTPAQELMAIVPADTDIEVEALVLNKDIGFVREGQAVEVKIEAFPFTKYGTIEGIVTNVSRDAVNNENLGLVYPTRISIKQKSIPAAGGEILLGPGMSITAEIKTGKRRIIQYLVAPLNEYVDESFGER